MRKYAIVIEKGENNLSAYVPDLPGCITTGRTVEEIERNMASRFPSRIRRSPTSNCKKSADALSSWKVETFYTHQRRPDHAIRSDRDHDGRGKLGIYGVGY